MVIYYTEILILKRYYKQKNYKTRTRHYLTGLTNAFTFELTEYLTRPFRRQLKPRPAFIDSYAKIIVVESNDDDDDDRNNNQQQ